MDPKKMGPTLLKKTNKKEVEETGSYLGLSKGPKSHDIFETHPSFYYLLTSALNSLLTSLKLSGVSKSCVRFSKREEVTLTIMKLLLCKVLMLSFRLYNIRD